MMDSQPEVVLDHNAILQQQKNFSTFPPRPVKPEEQNLLDEFAQMVEKHKEEFPHICAYVQKEADRINRGLKSAEEEKTLDIEGGKVIKQTYKVTVPIEKYPHFNYVGRLLGPKGSTLKQMQEFSGCKLAVLGKGSMRDKDKEEKCRLEGGKYSHLNEPLHIWMQAVGRPNQAFYKLHLACQELSKYLHADYNDQIFNEQMAILTGDLTSTHFRGGHRGRGMRGGASNRGFHHQLHHNDSHRYPNSNHHNMRGRGASRGYRANRGRGPFSVSNTQSDTQNDHININGLPAQQYTNGSTNSNQQAYYEHFPPMGGSGDATIPPAFPQLAAGKSKQPFKNKPTTPPSSPAI